MHVGFLHDSAERLLGETSRFQKKREVASFPKLRNTQLHRAGSRLPKPIAVAIALVDPIGTALARCSASQALNLQRHQALSGEADHLAQQIGVGTLFQKRAKRHHVVGHRGLLGWFGCGDQKTYRRFTMTTLWISSPPPPGSQTA